jgi:3-oxoacyl-[acyl-carrier protein] reductase
MVKAPEREILMLLQGKKAIIYGGGGAIGGAAARTFAAEGATVFLAGRTLASLDRVAREIVAAGGKAETAQVDALDEGAVTIANVTCGSMVD